MVESNGEEQIDLSHKPDLSHEEEIESEHADSVISDSRFRQFSDEELEKFVKFAMPDKVIDDASKVQYLMACLQELKTMIQDLRRADKDPLVADLLLRDILPKIEYYNQTRNVDDYNRVIRLMKEVQHEIEECATQTTTNLAEEIFKTLKLQGIIMKKT